jgi:hypothetical protein
LSKPVQPNEFAQAEILHELRRYEEERVGLGDRLWEEIQTAGYLISTYPEIGETVRRVRSRRSVRRFGLRHFPFFLIYREHPDYIELIALAPMSRKPNYWRSRIS